MFQSPRSGKFVSDFWGLQFAVEELGIEFQSPRSGKFVSDLLSQGASVEIFENVSIP